MRPLPLFSGGPELLPQLFRQRPEANAIGAFDHNNVAGPHLGGKRSGKPVSRLGIDAPAVGRQDFPERCHALSNKMNAVDRGGFEWFGEVTMQGELVLSQFQHIAKNGHTPPFPACRNPAENRYCGAHGSRDLRCSFRR